MSYQLNEAKHDTPYEAAKKIVGLFEAVKHERQLRQIISSAAPAAGPHQSFADVMNSFDGKMFEGAPPPRHSSLLSDVELRPIETAVRQFLKVRGWEWYHDRGQEFLSDVWDALMDQTPHAGSFLEKVWDGVGDWVA